MLTKNLNYYKSLEYNIIIEQQSLDSETWYIAYADELGKYACYGRGNNQKEALDSFLNEKNQFIEFLFENNRTIPEPANKEFENYSGNLSIRTSPEIHAKLSRQAKAMNISINLYINQILSATIEKTKLSN